MEYEFLSIKLIDIKWITDKFVDEWQEKWEISKKICRVFSTYLKKRAKPDPESLLERI